MNLRLIIFIPLICLYSNNTIAQDIMFLGNSLTYTNDLPKVLTHIAKKQGYSINTKTIGYPNYAIEDHWKDGDFQKLLKQKHYDYLIIQQGPSSQADGRQMLLNYGEKINTFCKSVNTRLAYFMVWPSKRYYFTFDGVIKNHTDAAKKNHSLLFPVGKVWQQYGKEYNVDSLYSNDGFHPSSNGTFLAALVIFHELFPDSDLSTLEYKNYKRWVSNKVTFNNIVELVSRFE